jgi:hypothetical protein
MISATLLTVRRIDFNSPSLQYRRAEHLVLYICCVTFPYRVMTVAIQTMVVAEVGFIYNVVVTGFASFEKLHMRWSIS